MSKAKELARELLKIQAFGRYNGAYGETGETYGIAIEDGGECYSWERSGLIELAKAVLSEPEPELKGWIEVTGRDGNKKLINLALVERVDVDTKSGVYLEFNRDDCVAYVKESYDSIKQKIRGAV